MARVYKVTVFRDIQQYIDEKQDPRYEFVSYDMDVLRELHTIAFSDADLGAVWNVIMNVIFSDKITVTHEPSGIPISESMSVSANREWPDTIAAVLRHIMCWGFAVVGFDIYGLPFIHNVMQDCSSIGYIVDVETKLKCYYILLKKRQTQDLSTTLSFISAPPHNKSGGGNSKRARSDLGMGSLGKRDAPRRSAGQRIHSSAELAARIEDEVEDDEDDPPGVHTLYNTAWVYEKCIQPVNGVPQSFVLPLLQTNAFFNLTMHLQIAAAIKNAIPSIVIQNKHDPEYSDDIQRNNIDAHLVNFGENDRLDQIDKTTEFNIEKSRITSRFRDAILGAERFDSIITDKHDKNGFSILPNIPGVRLSNDVLRSSGKKVVIPDGFEYKGPIPSIAPADLAALASYMDKMSARVAGLLGVPQSVMSTGSDGGAHATSFMNMHIFNVTTRYWLAIATVIAEHLAAMILASFEFYEPDSTTAAAARKRSGGGAEGRPLKRAKQQEEEGERDEEDENIGDDDDEDHMERLRRLHHISAAPYMSRPASVRISQVLPTAAIQSLYQQGFMTHKQGVDAFSNFTGRPTAEFAKEHVDPITGEFYSKTLEREVVMIQQTAAAKASSSSSTSGSSKPGSIPGVPTPNQDNIKKSMETASNKSALA